MASNSNLLAQSPMKQRKFLFITAIQARDIPLPTNDKLRKVAVKVKAGKLTCKTEVLKEWSASPSWSKKIHLSDLEASTVISFSLYQCRSILPNKCLSRCQARLQDFASDRKEITLTLDFATDQCGILTIHYESDICSAIKLVLPESAAVERSGNATIIDSVPAVQNLGLQILANSSTFVPILQSIDRFKSLFDELANIHPLASATWALLNLAYNALKNQNDKDKSIVKLYQKMMEAYMAASEDDVLKQYNEFKMLFDVILGQTMECALFISEYASKPYMGRFFTMNVLEKVDKFCQLFLNVEKQFYNRIVRKTVAVSLGTYSSVKFIEMEVALARLKMLPLPPHRDSCLTGTRVGIIEEIWCWIGKCEPGILWVHGVAGSGKSALASTIVGHARAMPGYHGRLGAFIRFDRSGVNDRSRVITTLAAKLAAFDDRIGSAIVDVVKNCPDINEWPLSAQFMKLVVETLESVEELRSEGPIIVVVDALDECDTPGRRADLLEIFSRGFGKNLPMMRFIVMSRPEEDIQQWFNSERSPHIVALPLAVRSESGQHDIRHYFDEKSREIQNREFQELWRQRDAAGKLAERANGHFIWAATAYEYIKEYPIRRLNEVLAAGESIGSSVDGDLDSLYKIALRSAIGARGSDIRADMLPLLGMIIVAKRPLPLRTIDKLTFGSGGSKSSIMLEKLGSIATFGKVEPVRLLHKSFDDFLTDQGRSGEWYVSKDDANKKIAMRCQAVLLEFLDRMHPRMMPTNADIFPDEIKYACLFWLEHVSSLPGADEDIDIPLRDFFQKHFLKWLEIMMILKNIQETVKVLQRLVVWTNDACCDESDRKTRYGAYQFARRFVQDIEDDPALIYTTALTFAPQNNVIRQIYSTGQSPNVIGNGTDRLLILCTHDCEVYSVAFSPDGTKVVSGSGSGAIHLWDAATGTSLGKLQNHSESVNSIAFSSDGSKLVSGSGDKTVQVWGVATGESLRVLRGHEGFVWSVTFSPDGSTIISGSDDCTIRLWDAASGELLLPPLQHDGFIYSVAFSPDGSRIVSGSKDKTIRLWDTSTGALHLQIDGHNQINSVAFSPDGSKIVSGSSDETIRLWDAISGAPLLEPLQCHAFTVYSVTFSRKGSEIVSASGDNTIRLSHSITGASLMESLSHDGILWMVGVSFDGSRIASVSNDQTLRVWDPTISLPEPLQGHNKAVNMVAFSTDGAILVSGSADNTIQMWDTITGLSRFGPIGSHGGVVTAVAFSSDGSKIVSASADSALRVWSTATAHLLHGPMNGHADIVRCIRFSNNGSKIFSGSDDNTVRSWDLALGPSGFHLFSGHEGSILSITESSDGSKLVTGSADTTVRVWEARTGISVLGPLRGHELAVTAVVFSPDESQIVSGSDDMTIRVWDSITGALLMEPLRGHDDPITYLAFSLDSSKLISASHDRTVRLWCLPSENVTLLPFDSRNRKCSLPPRDNKTITKFPRDVVPISVCVVEQAIYVAGVSKDSQDPPRGFGLMIIDISSLIA